VEAGLLRGGDYFGVERPGSSSVRTHLLNNQLVLIFIQQLYSSNIGPLISPRQCVQIEASFFTDKWRARIVTAEKYGSLTSIDDWMLPMISCCPEWAT